MNAKYELNIEEELTKHISSAFAQDKPMIPAQSGLIDLEFKMIDMDYRIKYHTL